MAQKKYQIFISSTYRDLKEERAAVIQAVLELKCIPVAMELFTAVDMEQLTYIRQEIAESDYYIVIVGGCYGSVNPSTGKSYTEHELEIARELHKPVLAFFYDDISSLPPEKRDADLDKQTKMSAFRENVLRKLGKSWTSPSDLSGKVSRSLTQLMRDRPAHGWVRDGVVFDRAASAAELNLVATDIRAIRESLSRSATVDRQGDPPSAKRIPDVPPVQSRSLFSVRTKLLGREPLIAGMVLPGAQRRLLIRAIGPSLAAYGITGVIPDPQLAISKADGTLVKAGKCWAEHSQEELKSLQAVTSAVGAFALPLGSGDAVAYLENVSGLLTVAVCSRGGYSGTVLVEAFEMPVALELGSEEGRNRDR